MARKPQIPRGTGVGYVRHYHREHEEYARRLEACGGEVDVYEILAVHFFGELDQVAPFRAHLDRPVIVHSYAYALGNAVRPSEAVRQKLQRVATDSEALAISEHIAVMGTEDTYAGTFLTPPGTAEQTRLLIENTKQLKRESTAGIVLENPVQFYNQLGPHSIGEQCRRVCEGANVGMLLSLSNVAFSDPYHPMDKDEFLAAIPLDRVEEIHYFLGHSVEQREPHLRRMVEEMAWQQRTPEELAATIGDHPQALELLPGFPLLAHALEKRPVGVADLQGLQKRGIGDAAVAQKGLGLLVAAEEGSPIVHPPLGLVGDLFTAVRVHDLVAHTRRQIETHGRRG